MSGTKWELSKKGKVRDIYIESGGKYIALVASDRVSAFDSVLPVEIEGKGKVLTEMSAFWFKEINKDWWEMPSAFITTDNEKMDSFFRRPEFERRTTLMKKLRMLPVEVIVRGYITGSLWNKYKNCVREFCGAKLPDGLQNCDQLERPLFTPTTKAPQGEHDESISFEEMAEIFEREGYRHSQLKADKVRNWSIRLYEFAHDYAKKRGVILADAKLEFGLDEDDNLYVADELFTPDSSRFWSMDQYKPGREQPSMSTHIIRNYIATHEGLTEIPTEVLDKTKAQYKKCLELLTK